MKNKWDIGSSFVYLADMLNGVKCLVFPESGFFISLRML